MAKKAEKSQGKAAAIRDYMAQNPDKGPQAVAEALKEAGFEVSAAYVSTIKSLSKKKGGRRGPRKAEGRAPVASGEGLSIAVLVQAKKLAAQLGGVAQAKAALDALAKLGV